MVTGDKNPIDGNRDESLPVSDMDAGESPTVPSDDQQTVAPEEDDRRRALELELIKVQREATAARLEARAAELELMIIQHMQRGDSLEQTTNALAAELEKSTDNVPPPHLARHPIEIQPTANNSSPESLSPNKDLPTSSSGSRATSNQVGRTRPIVFARNDINSNSDSQELSTSPISTTGPESSRPQASSAIHLQVGDVGHRTFDSWDALRNATPSTGSSRKLPNIGNPNATNGFDSKNASADSLTAPAEPPTHRVDAASGITPPHFAKRRTPENPETFTPAEDDDSSNRTAPKGFTEGEVVTRRIDTANHGARPDQQNRDQKPRLLFVPEASDTRPADVESEDLAIDKETIAEEETDRKQRKPAAFLVSMFAHVAVLLLLAAFTLSSHRPKDQVALSASVTEVSEETMETFEIKTSEQPMETSESAEPTEPEVEYDISDVGDVSIAELSTDAPISPPTPNITEMLNPSQMMATPMSMKSKSKSMSKFCGVEGGGNHFVYLVDSSGSMGAAFESARSELLRAIDSLKADQRFYVVFFDANSDYMRLADPTTDEPNSVKATDENKQALRRWAMRISMDRGRAPYDPLKFALKLKPDVIFLLSDGEFPQGIEDLLKENNKFENLFGDDGLISIVHTISYHSREGESRMRRIAEQNKGQYRHIPKP